MKFNYKVAEDVALQEVTEFVEFYAMNEQTEQDIRENYPQIIQAVRLGLLCLTDESASFSLKDPIKTESGSIALGDVQFKTRIPFSEIKKLSLGLNITKDRYE